MAKAAPDLRWGVERRLEFIEFRLFWEGGINRADITRYFNVSVPQASKDLTQYQSIAPENITYDRSEKRYFATEKFSPRFLKPDADTYFAQLRSIAHEGVLPGDTWLSKVPSFDCVTLPRRNVDPQVLLSVLQTIRTQKAIEVRYQSLSEKHPKPIWRFITPHALGHDGHRWHVRAFCHLDQQFKDFLLPRILGIREQGEPAAKAGQDAIWNELSTVILKPHPGLTDEQQDVIAQDFGMKGRKLVLAIRLALLYYFLRRLNLDFNEEKRPAREQHVVLANKDDVKVALTRAKFV